MTNPTFFTVIADFKSVVVDLATDVDADPTLGPVTAKVTFTPVLANGDVILATDASPRPTGYVAAPIVARIDADGRLKLRVEPDGDRDDFANASAFPGTGNTAKVYFAIDTQTFYRWTGSAYAETYPYAAVRLLADTALLELASDLYYRVSFSEVVFNGGPGYIAPFTFQAPSTDVELNLIEVMRQPGQPASGITKIAPGAVRLEDGEIVFSFAGVDIPDPIAFEPSFASAEITDSTATGRALITATSAAAARTALGEQVRDVKTYNATGDGTTDDTTAIHAARTAAGVGGKVYFPAGTYLVSGLTASIADQTWELSDGATIKAKAGAANILLINANGVTVTGGVFDGSNGTANDWSQQGIRVDEADGVTIRNIEVRDSPMHGVYNTNSNQFTVTDCRIIDHYGGGVFVLNGTDATVVSDILITRNHVESSGLTSNGIGVLGGGEAYPDRPVQRVKISHNTVILPTNPTQPTSTLSCIQCRDWIISDNISDGSQLGISNGTITRGRISNNVIRNFEVIGIEISGPVNGCTVSGNVIDGSEATEAAGILGASGGTETVNRLNIVGNTIFGFTGIMTAIALARVSGTTSALTSATIADNVIQADCSKFIGISFGLPVSNVTISGNTFDAATITTSVNGIEFQKAATNCGIVGNTFKSETSGTTNFPIIFTSGSDTASGISVTGNMFKAGVSAGYAPIQSAATLNNVTFTGNSVNAETSTFSSAVEIYGAANGIIVSGNQLTNLNQAVVRLLTSTAVTVQNVTVGGNNLVNVANRITNSTSGGAVVASSVITTDNDSTATLTNKSIALGSNTITGTLAQFNTAVTDANLARTDAANTFTGVQTMTSPAITTPTGIVKGDVGLGNVDNTSDANKPISTATQTALNTVNYYGWPGGKSGEYVTFGGGFASITGQAEGRAIFTPYWAPRSINISKIAIRVSVLGGSGADVRIGAYNDDDGIPGSLIFDAGTVSATTTGIKEITTSQTLPAGRFWLTAVVQGAASPLACLAGVQASNAWNSNALLMPQNDGMDSVYFSMYKGSVSGALPNPAFSSRSLSGGGSNNVGYAFRVQLA